MARDIYIDGRVLVSGAKGHLNLGNPVSLTQSILQVVIPNIPVLASLPYQFQNGLTEVVGTPSTVGLGGTLLNNTTINGTGFELQFDADTLSSNTIDYQIDTTNYSLKTSEILDIQNNVFDTECGLDFYIQSQLDLPVIIDGNAPGTVDGSKMTMEGIISNVSIASGFYNIIDTCNPYSTMQQSYYNNSTNTYGSSAVIVNDGVEIRHANNNGIADMSTSIGLEGSISINASNNALGIYQRIVLSTYSAPVFSGINDVTTDPYIYEFPNTSPNNGDIMIADGTGKFQHKPLEIHILATSVITGDVSQKTYFHLPFIENHVCTRINFVSSSTEAGDITIKLDDEHNLGTLDTLILPISTSLYNWGGSVDLTVPLASTNVNRLWSARISSNTQLTPSTALYLTLTFVPELV